MKMCLSKSSMELTGTGRQHGTDGHSKSINDHDYAVGIVKPHACRTPLVQQGL